MAYINNNVFSKDNNHFFNPSQGLNLLDNFKNIYIGGRAIPRIPFNSNNFNNIMGLVYTSLKDINYKNAYVNETIKSTKNVKENENHIYIQINADEKSKSNSDSNDKKNLIEKDNDEIKLFLNKKKDLNVKNNYKNEMDKKINFKNFGEIKYNIEPIPPASIISVINDDIVKRNFLEFNKANINNFQYINNIILNNINTLPNEMNISNYNNKNLITKNINENKSTSNFNFSIQPTNPSLNIDLTTPSSSEFYEKYSVKPLFFVSSEPTNPLDQKLKKHLKRGRKTRSTNTNKRIHSASDDDNIMRKIQVHFLSFLINYVNDVIRSLINKKNVPLFKNLDYKIKKTVNRKSVENLKSKKISEILQLQVSPKMKIHDESVNKNIYYKVCSICPFMYEFLQQSYISLFKEYYSNKNKIFQVNGKIIQVSNKTKTFIDLIEKNRSYKDKLKYIAINYFLNSCKKNKKLIIKKNIFNTHKDNDTI